MRGRARLMATEQAINWKPEQVGETLLERLGGRDMPEQLTADPVLGDAESVRDLALRNPTLGEDAYSRLRYCLGRIAQRQTLPAQPRL